jgi:gluconate 2-dehydrogenase gamma chain
MVHSDAAMRRRSFLALLLAASAALVGGLGWLLRHAKPFWSSGGVKSGSLSSDAPGAALPPQQRAVLQALCERLLPDEKDSPGARMTGAFDFIERELMRPELQSLRERLIRGAIQLDALAARTRGAGFAELDVAGQEGVIAASMSRESENRRDSMLFVRNMLSLGLEGMFSDPIHGGNRDEVGWELIGYTMRPPRPRPPARSSYGEASDDG